MISKEAKKSIFTALVCAVTIPISFLIADHLFGVGPGVLNIGYIIAGFFGIGGPILILIGDKRPKVERISTPCLEVETTVLGVNKEIDRVFVKNPLLTHPEDNEWAMLELPTQLFHEDDQSGIEPGDRVQIKFEVGKITKKKPINT